MENILEIKELVTEFRTNDGFVKAIDTIDLNIKKGEVLGLVGESGCGKSVTSLSIMGLLPKPHGKVTKGTILFEGKNLLRLKEEEMRKIRGNDIAMIFQEPMTALNPVFTIGFQIGEVLELHKGYKGKEKDEKVIQLLKKVGISRAEKAINEYPHQLSGGMRQRVMIAMALSCEPKLLIADEPTTALDVTIQAQVLEIMKDLAKEYTMSMLLITHDLGVIAEMADHVAVMYAGKIVEEATVVELFENPKHPYTLGLLRSRPNNIGKNEKLICIPGMVPNLNNMPKGCAFAPRCSMAKELCHREQPKEIESSTGHKVRCFFVKEDLKDE